MNQPQDKPKAIIMNVDETLTERVTWYALTEELGASCYEHADIFMSYLDGKISYHTAKQKLFQIWTASGPIHKDRLEEIFKNIHIRGEAIAVINTLQEKGYELCLMSGSIEMFIQTLAKKFGIKHYYGNSRFIFDKKGYWVDFEYTKEEAQLKVEQFQDFLKKTGLKAENCIAIGDGDNDLDLFRLIPGIIVNPRSEHLKELAWQDVKYLPRVIQLLESIK